MPTDFTRPSSPSLSGERCACGAQATHKIAEVFLGDEPPPEGGWTGNPELDDNITGVPLHPLSRYLCDYHFTNLLMPYKPVINIIDPGADTVSKSLGITVARMDTVYQLFEARMATLAEGFSISRAIKEVAEVCDNYNEFAFLALFVASQMSEMGIIKPAENKGYEF